jgi:hypothetical protein
MIFDAFRKKKKPKPEPEAPAPAEIEQFSMTFHADEYVTKLDFVRAKDLMGMIYDQYTNQN